MNIKFYGEMRDFDRFLALVFTEKRWREDGVGQEEYIMRLVRSDHPLGDAVMTGNEDWHFILKREEAVQLHKLLTEKLKLWVDRT